MRFTEKILQQGAIESKALEYFQHALILKDIELLDYLLHPNGKFFDKAKKEALEFFRSQFEVNIPEEFQCNYIELKSCIGCYLGYPTYIIHNGYWPKLEDEKVFKGITVALHENKIFELTICYNTCSLQEIELKSKDN